MKKIIIASLCVSALLGSTTTWAASSTTAPVTPATASTTSSAGVSAVSSAPVYTETAYTIKYDNKMIDLKESKIVQMNKVVLVPLRPVAEALGFSLHWDGEKQAIHVEDGLMQSDVRLGEDIYFAYSNGAIGMTTPEPLGVAPLLINNNTYVPVNFFKSLLTYDKAVSMADNLITLTRNPSEKTRTAAVKTTSTKEGAVGLANPIVDYKTLTDARKAAGVHFAVPTLMPVGYEMKEVSLISSKTATIHYVDGDKKIVYRTEKGDVNISGDYNVYNTVRDINIGSLKVLTKGDKEDISLAEWVKDGFSYSMSFEAPVQGKTLAAIIDNIQ